MSLLDSLFSFVSSHKSCAKTFFHSFFSFVPLALHIFELCCKKSHFFDYVLIVVPCTDFRTIILCECESIFVQTWERLSECECYVKGKVLLPYARALSHESESNFPCACENTFKSDSVLSEFM